MKAIPLLVLAVFILSGCVVRTYTATRERLDQELSEGNRGYLKGQAHVVEGEAKERRTTRDTQIVEIELRSPIKFEKLPKQKGIEIESIEKTEALSKDTEVSQLETAETTEAVEGNRGFITESAELEIKEPAKGEKYTVQKGDTLQKISHKFYGTTRKWNKVYEANQEVMKGPNHIYPGQVIDIPGDTEAIIKKSESLKETEENLK